ncbi:hypothetical protein EW026_g1826 [Hermanssonia centrifuga]|uniref:Uncharacterized protein n=1 Tax=Hermanssonia centrifuga TaxID=98765 RepID=A0A4V6S111_9APHY|nr:hypothetical protein EW026_g1826 [Hermanssonia centrifuga]
MANTKDAERCNSGVLDMKALDNLECYEAAPIQETAKFGPVPLHSSPSALFDNSPVISEILRQISTSNVAVHDLRTQLTDVRAAAAESHAAIQSDLNVHRERKRAEDSARAELKTRTKALEDSKRSAEASKRDAEKRLRAAESARASASERIEKLDKEIGKLRVRMGSDEEAIVRCQEEGDKTEKGMAEELEKKRKEIKIAEDVVAALNTRTKELEAKIVEEEERLKRAKEQAELKKQDRAFYPLHVVNLQEAAEPSIWSPIISPVSVQAHPDPHSQINTEGSTHISVFSPGMQGPAIHNRGPSVTEDHKEFSTSPRPRHLSLAGISNFSDHHQGISDVPFPHNQVTVRPMFQDEVPSLSSGRTQSTRFSPFGDNELEVPVDVSGGMGISPRSTSLIPTSLIKSLEGGGNVEDMSRSFQSENDSVMERDWRKMHPFTLNTVESPGVFSSSPTSLTCPTFDGVDKEDPFEIRPPPPPLRHRITSDGFETERAMHLNNLRTSSDPQPLVRSRTRESDEEEKAIGHRRWFSSSKEPKEKKGLNPEAKAFQFNQFKMAFPSFSIHKPSPYEGLVSQPSSMASSLSVPSMLPPPSSDSESTFSTLSMRAFAPSPAEREALSRALGSSTNTSLERIPTLSDVVIGSMPSSPNHVHAVAAQRSPPHVLAEPNNRSLLSPGLAWLQSLPRMKKPRFSPWDDEVVGDADGGVIGR